MMADDLFEGFESRTVDCGEAEIFARIGGSGPPLLLLHGYPQTHVMWHKIAGALAERFTVVAADLRGYGASSKPPSDADHAAYSKRAMARDMAALMTALGFERFDVLAHDRGARVAHRLGMDHAARVGRMMLLDIAPTREMYAATNMSFATAYWHWFFLIQPSPIPERIIEADPEYFWEKKCGFGAEGMGPFDPRAVEAYLAAWTPEVIHASCEDYRAGATIDIAHDDADAGARLEMPVCVLWGANGVIEREFDCLALWRQRAAQVTGRALPGGHYLAEEVPDDVLAEALTFFG